MIPTHLRLSNFTSYGENPPELDFTRFKLAAISGLNGAGKSSILDAITWCLWGSSRAGDSADELIHSGAEKMIVEFSFQLDGHLFTVKRQRIKKGGGSTSLELWSNSHNLTEGTIKATQQKIIDTLHLTFETFTNSAYLRQGHADEFTTKGPTDRKRILADILGLSQYDQLEERAKEKSKEAQTRLAALEYQLIEIEAEISLKSEREKKLSQIQTEEREIKSQLQQVEEKIKEIEGKRQLLHTTVKTLEQQKETYLNLQKELTQLQAQIELKQKAQKEYREIFVQKEEIEKNYQKLLKLSEEKKALDTLRTQLITVKDELVDLEKTINERENKRKDAIAKLEILASEFKTKNDNLENQNKKLKEDKNICPTCNQPIGEEKNLEIVRNNLKQIEENNKEIGSLETTVQKYNLIVLPEYQKAQEVKAKIQQLETATKDYQSIGLAIGELEKYRDLRGKLKEAEVGVKTHQEAILDLEKIYKPKRQELEKIENLDERLKDSQERLEEVEKQLQAEQQVKHERSQYLLSITGQVGEARQLVSRATQMQDLHEKKSREKAGYIKQKEAYEELALAFGKKGIQAMIIEQAIPEIEIETNNLLNKLTEGRMKVRLETQRETKTKIQTNEGKAYGTVETLDIIISDEMGERPYELYSGGETFRVNFAIRLAISKLLTHRAGTRLQFLVIDEGFGTQDAPGRARLVEVLDTIKDDFEKILVITHIEELKEEFPVRIEVSKNSAGSTFKAVGV